MKGNKNLAVIILSIFLMIGSLSTAVFAWFGLVEKTQEIIIYSGTVELEVHLYDSDDNEINDITITKVVPGDVHNFKLTIKNLGSIRSDLDVIFTLNASSNLNENITFTITDTESPVHSGSVTFDEEEYLYENILTYQKEVTLNFSVTIGTSIELEDLLSGFTIEIESIEIILEQII